MNPLLRVTLPYLIGAAAVVSAGAAIAWYGHTQREAGRAKCQEAHHVAGLEEFKTEAERLNGLSQSFADTGVS